MSKAPYHLRVSECSDKLLQPFIGERCFYCRRTLGTIRELRERAIIWTGVDAFPLACGPCDSEAAR